jgi:hypothetical protein
MKRGQTVPEFDTILAVRQQERLRSLERMVDQFDAPATASIIDRDLLLNSGVVGTETVTYSWPGPVNDVVDPTDPEYPWQPTRLDRARRVYRFEVECPSDNLANFTGTTTIELLKNGSVIASVSLADDEVYGGVDVAVTQVVLPKDLVTVRATASGNHYDGAVRILLADPV